jgi:transcriptional regulator with XRE-family HTH domain
MEIGKKIKAVIEQKGMTTSEFARRLCTTNQNAHDIFKRTSIDTEQLERIGAILEHDFFQYYVKPSSLLTDQTKSKTRVLVEVEIDDELKKALKTKLLQVLE